jgi:sulfite oxidase
MTPFDKHPDLIVQENNPFNGGPTLELLRQNFITPTSLFFVRNHAPVPEVDPASYRLTVSGMVSQPLSLSLEDLRAKFPRQQVTAVLQCAGNRRDQLLELGEIPGEVPWSTEAISNGVWEGVALRDILAAAGVQAEARHVAFLGLDQVEKDNGETFGFGGSIPIDKATTPEVLLAYAMNGETLPPVHGFPLRVVVPGNISARSVKWLANIHVQPEPSDNYYQAHAYKLFPPQTTPETVDWKDGLMLGEMPINSLIWQPLPGETLPAGKVTIRGYALVGGGRHIERVDVSIDGGQHWRTATLEPEESVWAWRFWHLELDLVLGTYEITVRAWDSATNTQPPDASHVWNFKGYMNNAWHRVRVQVR